MNGMKANINNWIRLRFPEHTPTSDGNEIRVNCPFCQQTGKSHDTKQHMYISQVKPLAHCFRCDWSGSYVWLIKQVDNCSFAKAYQQIDSPLPDLGSTEEILSSLTKTENKDLPDVTEGVPVGFRPLVQETYRDDSLSYMAVLYLASRGIVTKDIFGGKWGVVDDKPYVFTTIENIFWQGRRIVQGDPKYLNPNLPKSHGVLYNGHHLVDPEHPKLYVVEGVFSAYTLEKRDNVHATALLAKTAVGGQLKRLAAYPGRLVVMLDHDALENAFVLAEQLLGYGHNNISIAHLKEGDPDECGDWEEFRFDLNSTIALKFGLSLTQHQENDIISQDKQLEGF